jgi:hypothetical protein
MYRLTTAAMRLKCAFHYFIFFSRLSTEALATAKLKIGLFQSTTLEEKQTVSIHSADHHIRCL